MKERKAYENSLKHCRDLNNAVDTSREEGWEEGREEGLEEGRKEGRKARDIELARAMLKKGISMADVSQITGLDLATVKSLGGR